MMEYKFYVYEHWRPDRDVCFYVGKGLKKRAFQLSRKENKRHSRILAKLARLGMCAEVRLVAGGLKEGDAFALEVERIAFWRATGVELANMTDGGEGGSGHVWSEESRAKLSRSMKGKPGTRRGALTSEHRKAIGAGLVGRVVSAETRSKISAAQRGKPRPEQAGRKLSPAGLERLRNREFTPEHRARISAAKRGVPKSDDHRRKLSEALLARSARNRGEESS